MGRTKDSTSMLISGIVLIGVIVSTLVLNAVPYFHELNETVFESRLLMPILNSLFQVLASFVVAYLLINSYLLSGSPILYYFAGGMLVLGSGSLLAGWFLGPYGPNFTVTVHNVTVLVAAMFHLTGIVMRLAGRSAEMNLFRRRVRSAVMGVSIIVFVALLSVAAAKGVMSPFFVQPIGPTQIRQTVLAAALLLLIFSFSSMMVFYFERKVRALYWYSLGLGFLIVGIGSIYLQTAVGSVMGWIGRLSQYTAGVYFLAAALSALKTARTNGILLTETLANAFQRSESKLVRSLTV